METLQITKAQRRSISNYKRMGIDLEVLDNDLIKITQSRLINGYVLNQKQLVERAKEVFPDAKIIPVVFSLDVDSITVEWIEGKMKEFGISRNDLIKQLAIDKSSLSLYFSGKRGLDKSQRAAFYFYFLTYELNRDFREVNAEDQAISKNEDISNVTGSTSVQTGLYRPINPLFKPLIPKLKPTGQILKPIGIARRVVKRKRKSFD